MPGSLNWRTKHARKMFTRCGLGAACWLRDGFDLGKRRRRSSTPAVVPGAAPALAKAGVGGFHWDTVVPVGLHACTLDVTWNWVAVGGSSSGLFLLGLGWKFLLDSERCNGGWFDFLRETVRAQPTFGCSQVTTNARRRSSSGSPGTAWTWRCMCWAIEVLFRVPNSTNILMAIRKGHYSGYLNNALVFRKEVSATWRLYSENYTPYYVYNYIYIYIHVYIYI